MIPFNVPSKDVRHLNRVYDLYSSRVVKIERDYIESTYRRRSINVSCQCNIRRDLMCTCRRLPSPELRYFSTPKQVYRYTDYRSFTDIGVGSIKALPRKRIRKVYLPETIDTAVGSADLSSYINGRSKQQWPSSYYENKRTSSKCVGGFVEDENVPSVNKKLSPIIQKKSGTTSPKSEIVREQDVNIKRNDLEKRKSSTSTKVNVNENNANKEPKLKSEITKIKSNQTSKLTLQGEVTIEVLPTVADKLKSAVINENAGTCKDYSSDSFVTHVHNLENPSYDKQSKISVDPMENKLEREYRKIFTSKSKEQPSVDKPIPDFKSASLLRRRFEALRRGLGKKESKRESVLINNNTSHTSMPSHKDVSIASDPPSLEGRSYSNTKVYSPYQSTTNEYKPQEKIPPKKSPKSKKNKDDAQWSPELGDNKYESVQGMFKLWGKKFNFDEENCKTSPTISNDKPKSPEELSKSESPQAEFSKKKQGRKFFIFGKKTKDKDNKPFKPKKGVTAGRCEVKDGLTIKVGAANEYSAKETVKKQDNHLEKYDNLLRKAWLDRYITNTRESRNSVHIRWNNKMYATSSSTVLELMDSMYKYTGINIRSRSEITTGESSNYHSYTKQRVHFMQKDIEAWMIPKMITNKHQTQAIDYRAYHNNNNKCQRWFVDASKGFSQKIELVLRSKPNSNSSEYVIINIPEGYFSHSSSDLRAQSSDEKIYKIVEYDTSELKKIKETRHMATGDNLMNDTKVNDSTQNNNDKPKILDTNPGNIQKPSLLRDVAIQGSNVFLPKRCDVIGVGIITQRDIRDVKKPIIKIEDDLSDDESEENRSSCQKKCELAESYLQDYCRNWIPSGIDMFSWRISDSQHSENNSVASLSQGDGTKSYPNMYDNFQESTIVLSSCETSSCSHCMALEEEKKPDDSLKTKFLSKFKKKPSEAPLISDKRNCPKDSLEVHKKRQFYAINNQKSKWYLDEVETPSVESIGCRAKNTDNQKVTKPCWKIPKESKKKKHKQEKHVSLPGCMEMCRLADNMSDKSLEGILSYKGSACNKKGSNSPKRAEILSKPKSIIPQPICKDDCVKKKNPPCSKKKSSSCNDLLDPQVNLKAPIPPCKIKAATPPRTPPNPLFGVKKLPCSACSQSPRQMSNVDLCRNLPTKTPSQQSGISYCSSPKVSPKPSEISFTIKPDNLRKQKECKPNCANTNKFLNKLVNTPSTPPPTVYHKPIPSDCTNTSKERVTGLHLKKFPAKKRASSETCYDGDGLGVIRLNSQEKFTVRMKQETPSTEEIRESLNIRVQDADGQTLYERIDYKQSGDVNKCLLLKDMYKDSQIQRVTTPGTVQGATTQNKSQNLIREVKSDSSVDNLIEINFTLKLKQGDKNKEVNIKNAGDTEINQKNEGKVTESQKSIYIVQNRTEQDPIVIGNKKDVNIKIVIKNYKVDPEKCNETETCAEHNVGNDVFNKRISEKFQTVSTGYSDIDQHAFSVHRATVDLSASVDRYEEQNKVCTCKASNELVNIHKNLVTSSQSITECSLNNQTVRSMMYDKGEEISTASMDKESTNNDQNCIVVSHDETDKFNDSKSEKNSIMEFKNQTADETSNESILYKKLGLHNRAQKKAMLKKLFRSSSVVKKPENKKKIKEIIHAILTSDSSGTEIAVTSNELAKELTYASLDPGYFRNTDSMNNYYKFDNVLSNRDESTHQRLNPTKNNSEFSDDSDVSSVDDKHQECLCSTFATKLNISLNSGPNNCGCCCQGRIKNDKDINCDVGTNDCFLNLKAGTDVQTQISKHVLNKLNSANILMRSKSQSVVIANTSVTIKNSINEHPAAKRKSSQTYLPNINDFRYGIKRLNRETVLGLSDDDMLVLNSNVVQKSVSKCKRKRLHKYIDSMHADILQLNETKKAVLEIYKERIVSDEGEKIVAKLPKFHVEKENDITNYEDMMIGRKNVSKRNFVMMTFNR